MIVNNSPVVGGTVALPRFRRPTLAIPLPSYELHAPPLFATGAPLMQSIRTSGLAATMLVTGGELQKLEPVQKLVVVGFRIVGSVMTDMSTPFRASEP